MTLREAIEILDELDSDLREYLITEIIDKLTYVSLNTMMEAYIEWDNEKQDEEFKEKETMLLKECIAIEMTTFGSILRELENLPPLKFETKIL
ncbi:MAG: hypothetical protein QXD05_01470 [Candidatus Pacearchaeota archaeon]